MGNITYSIEGKIINSSNNEPIPNVSISDNLNNTSLSQPNGNFNLTGDYNPENTTQITLTISAPGFTSQTINLLKPNKDIKQDPLILLTPVPIQNQLDKSSLLSLSSNQTQILKTQLTPDPTYVIINKTSTLLKQKLLPFLLSQIAAFGLTKVTQKKPKTTCPPQDKLIQIIKQRNKISTQLNNLFKTLGILQTTTQTLTNTITPLSSLITTLELLPFPIPPGTPINVIGRYEDTKDKVRSLLKTTQSKSKNSQLSLDILQEDFNSVLDYMNLLDNLIQECSNDLGNEVGILTEINQLSINPNTNLPLKSFVNGFILEIETENTPNKLKRKRAIAKNSQGVIIIRGNYSFSSSDQILIDELSFNITKNNLKPE